MPTIWFCLIAVMLIVYVLLDGFDLGAGIVHLRVARTDAERREVLASIGSVWDGNEVWLIATGGVLYFAFPVLYASGFSGFYLPLMIVLWLLILRGIAIEFRNHVASPAWTPLWDGLFSLSSMLLAVFFGVALGNVVRGVPLSADGYFFEPLWTDFQIGRDNGILDWYTALVGVSAYLALRQHGALWVGWRTGPAVRERAARAARTAWWGTAAGTALVTWATFHVQPHVLDRFRAHPSGWVLPFIAIAGLGAGRWWLRAPVAWGPAFLTSCAYLAGMLASVAFGVYPFVLLSSADPAAALTVDNASAARYGLEVGLVWWVIGIALAAGYFTFLYRHLFGPTPGARRDS